VRDYARKLPSSEKKSDHASGRWFSNFMLILALIFASVAVYQFIQNHLPTQNIKSKLIEHKKQIEQHFVRVASQKPKPKRVKKKKTGVVIKSKSPTSDEPTFDFYKLLPQMTVSIPASGDEQPR